MESRTKCRISAILLLVLPALPLAAAVHKDNRPVDALLFVKPELTMRADFVRATELGELAGDPRFAELRVSPQSTMVDRMTGRLASLLPATPLIPGRGVGNQLAWSGAPPADRIALEQAAGEAFRAYVAAHAGALGVRMDELAWPGKVAALSDDLINVHVPRVVGGIEVRESYLTASIKYGNIILLGTANWADFDGQIAADLGMEQAVDVLRRHVGVDLFGRPIKSPYLVYVPLRVENPAGGESLTYRLAWVFENDLREPGGRFEATVDAATGELLALKDQIQWVAAPRRAQGGVYPVANDQIGPEGTEQTGWPMPFARITSGPTTYVTDIGGNAPVCLDGAATTVLSGPFVDMQDLCGADSLTSANDNLDWLSGPAPGSTDCTTPGVGGAGNTKASRTGYHELSMLKQQAISWLPANTWLQAQLPAVMNIIDTCNANWNGTSVNFFRSGGGCRNTGEIAGIFDHEWGHGMDNNDAVPTVSNPGEGIADIYANLRLNTSCVGRGFFMAGVCGGYGDPCTVASGCSGVRDTDWAHRVSGAPHDILWINTNCPGSGGPCNNAVHCEGAVYAEAVWDLWNRDLTAPPFSYDLERAREIATHTTFLGATGVGAQWYTCDITAPYDGGCAADAGYKKYLAADDDNGNINDGTPHMGAIFAAFDRHKVACQTPANTTSGCAGAPASAPTVTLTPRNKGVDLSWTAVGGTTEYEIYRTDGVFACNFGKIRIGATAGTTFEDRGLQNGRSYSYQVIPKGAADSCYGPASACQSAAPAPGGGGADLAAITVAASSVALGGDSDFFIDNCETLKITLPVGNGSTVTLTNVQITAATSTSHPGSVLLTTLPKTVAASMPACDNRAAVVEFQAQGLDPGEVFEVDITLDATEVPAEVVHVVSGRTAEGNFQNEATFTYNFVADAQGWTTEAGTFNRVNAGVGAPSPDPFFFQSSANLANQCDRIRSPMIRLSATSTMTLQNHFDIEPFYAPGGVWYDRANVVFRDDQTQLTTLLSPSSGRTYNASGPNGTCGTENQAGWAASALSWAASNWTAAALNAPTLAGKPGNLVIRYGTDPALHPSGFRFDVVTLTNFDRQVADTQSNTCGVSNYIFADDFNGGNDDEWDVVLP